MTKISDTQFTIIQGILATSSESPSLDDLDEMIPSADREELQKNLLILIEAGMVKRIGADDTDPRYSLTDQGKEELSGTGVLEGEVTLGHFLRKTTGREPTDSNYSLDGPYVVPPGSDAYRVLRFLIRNRGIGYIAPEVAETLEITQLAAAEILANLAERGCVERFDAVYRVDADRADTLKQRLESVDAANGLHAAADPDDTIFDDN